MTDNEIIEALECCIIDDCKKCPLGEIEHCVEMLDALDLINRQKAEIERLKAELEDKQFRCDSCDRIGLTRSEHRACVNQAKAEAIKEFAERAKDAICENTYPSFDKDGKPVNIWKAKSGYDVIDNIVKEMVGETNARGGKDGYSQNQNENDVQQML